jgi:hypothetical protein
MPVICQIDTFPDNVTALSKARLAFKHCTKTLGKAVLCTVFENIFG